MERSWNAYQANGRRQFKNPGHLPEGHHAPGRVPSGGRDVALTGSIISPGALDDCAFRLALMYRALALPLVVAP